MAKKVMKKLKKEWLNNTKAIVGLNFKNLGNEVKKFNVRINRKIFEKELKDLEKKIQNKKIKTREDWEKLKILRSPNIGLNKYFLNSGEIFFIRNKYTLDSFGFFPLSHFTKNIFSDGRDLNPKKLPELKRKGIGKAVEKWVVEKAKEASFKRIRRGAEKQARKYWFGLGYYPINKGGFYFKPLDTPEAKEEAKESLKYLYKPKHLNKYENEFFKRIDSADSIEKVREEYDSIIEEMGKKGIKIKLPYLLPLIESR